MNIPVDQFCANMLGIYVNLFFISMPHVTRVTWNALKTDIFLNSLGPHDDFQCSPPERRIFVVWITACSSSISERCHQDFCCKTTDILAKGSTVIPTSPQISVYVKFHILKTQWSCSAKKGGSEFSQLMPTKKVLKNYKKILEKSGKSPGIL